jgi:hypothetical protein
VRLQRSIRRRRPPRTTRRIRRRINEGVARSCGQCSRR